VRVSEGEGVRGEGEGEGLLLSSLSASPTHPRNRMTDQKLFFSKDNEVANSTPFTNKI